MAKVKKTITAEAIKTKDGWIVDTCEPDVEVTQTEPLTDAEFRESGWKPAGKNASDYIALKFAPKPEKP